MGDYIQIKNAMQPLPKSMGRACKKIDILERDIELLR